MIRTAFASLIAFLLLGAQLSAQDQFSAARDLYATARYDEALSLLDRLSSSASSTDERQSIDFYRTLCLFAVGRRDDADRTIEAIIARDPLYRPGDEVSPRTRAAFTDAKRRVLPAVVQQYYAEAKQAFDRREFETAAAAFRQVLDALNDPDMGAAGQQPPLSDLRTVAVGFHDLSVKSIPPPPPPPPPAPEPVAAPVNLPPRVYTGEEAGIRPPIAVSQEMPRYPGPVPPSGFKGIVDVVIGESGVVESAQMVIPVTRMYDNLVLNATRRWQFQPALMNGAPVKFKKRIQINISPPTR